MTFPNNNSYVIILDLLNFFFGFPELQDFNPICVLPSFQKLCFVVSSSYAFLPLRFLFTLASSPYLLLRLLSMQLSMFKMPQHSRLPPSQSDSLYSISNNQIKVNRFFIKFSAFFDKRKNFFTRALCAPLSAVLASKRVAFMP